MKNKRLFIISNSITALMLGGLIYLISGSETYLSEFIRNQFDFNLVYENSFIIFARNYLCDGLWAYSLYNCILMINDNVKSAYIIALSASVIWEFAQLFNLIKGTFDIADIFSSICFVSLACVINKLWRR